jgi:hypothetical protein
VVPSVSHLSLTCGDRQLRPGVRWRKLVGEKAGRLTWCCGLRVVHLVL